MTDHFAALDQPPRPWLEPGALREHYHLLTTTLHPDVPGTGDASRFAAVNAAYQVLRDHASRLRHLQEITAPGQKYVDAEVPSSIATRFMTIATLRRAFAEFIAQQQHSSHPLQRALLAAARADLELQVAAALSDLERVHHEGVEEVRTIDANWPANRTTALLQIAALQAQFAYLAKWIAQLQELRFQLDAMR